MYRYLFLAVFFLVCGTLRAQTPDTAANRNKKDSLIQQQVKPDSVPSKVFKPKIRIKQETVYHPDSTHSPHKAVMRSLILPGWGQIYNRHGLYWRLPVLYGGMGMLIYSIITYTQQYHLFLSYAQAREQGQIIDPYSYASSQAIYDVKDGYLRNLQISWFGLAAVWGVNMVDAYVEAKFIHSYTMDNDLSFKIAPSLINQPVYASNINTTFTPALKITFLFK